MLKSPHSPDPLTSWVPCVLQCAPCWPHVGLTDHTWRTSSHMFASWLTHAHCLSSSETYINPIGNALCQVFLPSEVSDLIREGLQLDLQQRAEEEHREQIWQRVLEARARVEERLHCEERIPPRHPPFPNLVPHRWFRGVPPRSFLRNHIAPLRPRESLRLPPRFCEDYICH